MISHNGLSSIKHTSKTDPERIRTFRNGEILYASVKKSFSNGTAEIQAGSQKLIARLEAEVKPNKGYWMQVSSHDGEVQLKLVSDGGAMPQEGKDISQLLKNMNIPNTKSTGALLQFFEREQLPFTKEVVQLASQWLKDVSPIETGLQALKSLMAGGMPLSKNVFQSLLSFEKGMSTTNLLTDLKSALNNENQSKTAQSLIRVMGSMDNLKGDLAASKTIHRLVDMMLTSDGDTDTPLTLLKKAGVVEGSSKEQVLSSAAGKFAELVLNDSHDKGLIEIQQAIKNGKLGQGVLASKDIKLILETLLKTVESSAQTGNSKVFNDGMKTLLAQMNDNTPIKTEQLFRHLLEGYSKINSGDFPTLLGKSADQFRENSNLLLKMTQSLQSLPPDEAEMLHQVFSGMEREASESMNKNDALYLLKGILQKLGINYESILGKGIKDDSIADSQLKPLLVQFLQDNPAPAVKDAAQNLLNHLNGQSILSADNGPLQTIVMQVPFTFFSQKTDLTIQWSGKKNEKGQIDADHCRILFYLDLHSLDETMIDMNVQNRIVSLTIYNQHEIKNQADSMVESLKRGWIPSDINCRLFM